jgi:hypothetical protein
MIANAMFSMPLCRSLSCPTLVGKNKEPKAFSYDITLQVLHSKNEISEGDTTSNEISSSNFLMPPFPITD